MDKLPLELVNKIIMYQIPTYKYLDELKITRVIIFDCICKNCCDSSKYHIGCDNIEFNSKDINSFGQILCLNFTDYHLDLIIEITL